MNNTAEEYNGYSNRETWATCLWLSNDYGLYLEITEVMIPAIKKTEPEKYWEGQLARELKEYVTDGLKALADESPAGSDIRLMFDDIGSLWRVDWYELAKVWLTY